MVTAAETIELEVNIYSASISGIKNFMKYTKSDCKSYWDFTNQLQSILSSIEFMYTEL